jgi:hypothetical protein
VQVSQSLADLVYDSGSFFLSEQGATVGMVFNLMKKLATLQVLSHQEEPFIVLESLVEFKNVRVVKGLQQ